MLPWIAALLLACSGGDTYIVEGLVLETRPDGTVVVQHEEVQGLMGAMTMPFAREGEAAGVALSPGDRIVARLVVRDDGSALEKVRVVGRQPLPKAPVDAGPAPVRPGEVLPRTEIPVHGGGTWVVGEGQEAATALTFLYTRCPLPEFCPMTVSRLQGLQGAVGTEARIVAVTIDPDHDTLDVLSTFAETVGARPEVWRFGRLEGQALQDLALRAALPITSQGSEAEIVHGTRLLVLDRQGRLVERYDDNHWPLERVVEQLRTGGPAAPPESDGTISRPPSD